MSSTVARAASGTIELMRRCWRCRWPCVRLAVAAVLLITTVVDIPALITRRQIAAMPGYDYTGEARRLHQEGRYGEALLVIDAGLGDSDAGQSEVLSTLRTQVVADRDSWVRRAREFGIGALVGQGESLEAIIGAISADMFIVGDIRDLVIQSGRLVTEGDADELILCLSAVGVATTLLPEVDWAPALLKVGRKVGAVGEKLAEALITIVKRAALGKDRRALEAVVSDTTTLARKMTPGGFLRLVRHVDDPAELAKLARFAERDSDAAFALYRSGPDGVRVVTAGDKVAADALLTVSRKGDAGMSWLRHGKARLLRPHPLIGLTKSLWKGNLQRGFLQAQGLLDRYVGALLPALLAWVIVECFLIRRAFRRPLAKPT